MASYPWASYALRMLVIPLSTLLGLVFLAAIVVYVSMPAWFVWVSAIAGI